MEKNKHVLSDVIAHNLRIFGFPVDDGKLAGVEIFQSSQIGPAEAYATDGGVAIVLVEANEKSLLGDIVNWHTDIGIKNRMVADDDAMGKHCKLATFHHYATFVGTDARQAIIKDVRGREVWVWKPIGKGGVLLLGTDLAGDLIRLRQGDPAKANNPDTQIRWGIAGERPNYLYEQQREGANKYDRDADWWVMVLTRTLADCADKELLPLLPNNARGAIVITGDDDQAYLEKYEEQLSVLNGLPITYFLHPLTKHTKETLKTILGAKGIDLGIHPDALDEPEKYDEIFHQQYEWFSELTGENPISARNHGFLNRGYWGHKKAWKRGGIKISSNIPGLDGNLITSSLIPARVHYDNELTGHWSIMTAIGDGVVFVHEMSPKESRECVLSLGSEIIQSQLPGVIVLNLHPQNISEASGLHEAIHELVKQGFVPWNMKDCFNWFNARDEYTEAHSSNYTSPKPTLNIVQKFFHKIMGHNIKS
ncbi:hypothetical protein OAT77_03935 [Alphaproteobacteria bacterium]|nr:hypothetical protein [Alphaproteobacteria bacterium]